MRNTNKKGFTIVELVIVVAVIAILAAVLIPTFSGIIAKANLSADQQAVRNMNIALAAETNKPSNIIDAAAILAKAGFNTEKGLSPAYKGHSYYWFKPTNQVVYVDETDGKFDLIFPEKVEGFPIEKTNDCQPLSVAIEGVVNVPTINGTTVGISGKITESTVAVPETVTDFASMVEWLNGNNFGTKLYMTYNNFKRLGAVLSGGEIKLTEDIVIGKGLNAGDNMIFNIVEDTIIDLNGHTLTAYNDNSGRSYAAFVVRTGATLTIIDSSAEKTGAILVPFAAFQVDAGATLNIHSGTIGIGEYRSGADINADLTSGGGVSLVNMNGGTFNMYGGVLDTRSESPDEVEYALGGYYIEDSKCNLYGGTIYGNLGDNNGIAGTVTDFGVEIK